MEDFEHRFEHYLQGHLHPEVHGAARRLTHETLGSMSIEAFLAAADIFQASHEAMDRDLDEGQAEVGWTPQGDYVDNHAPVIERTPLAQQDFERRAG